MKNYLIIITAFLFSCTSAPKHLSKAIAKDKPYVAAETRKLFPCIVTASDTTYRTDTLYDLIEAQCPDVDYITPEGKTVVLPGRTTQLPGKTIYRDRVIKERVEDSAKIFSMNNEMGRMDTVIGSQESEIKDLTKARNKWRKWCMITWFILGLGIAGKIIFKSYKLL